MPSETIIGVKKDGQDKITHVKYKSGKVMSVSDAVRLAKMGFITNAVVGKNRYGEENLRSRRDREDSTGRNTNLKDLPSFEEPTL